jgi:4-amino-4-deoxy-L-arabinose transferase-like glycosyltransferase
VVSTTGLAFVLRLINLDGQSLWRDEVDAIRFAFAPVGDLARMMFEPGQNGPWYYLFLRPWLTWAGDSEFSLRFFSLFFGVLAVPLIYIVGRRLFPQRPVVAPIAALLAATSPYLVWYGQEGKMYALVVFLVLLSMERYLAALERGGAGRWVVYVASTSAAFYTHLIAAFIVPVQALVFFLGEHPLRIRRWRPWLVSMLLLTAPYLPLLVWQLPLLVQPGETGFSFVPLHQMAFTLFQSYSRGVVYGAAWWALVPFAGLLLAAGLLWRGRSRDRFALGLLLTWILLPVLGLFLVSLRRPLFTARYLIFTVPAYCLLLAGGLASIGRRSRLVAIGLFMVILGLNGWSLRQQVTTPLKADFRAATAYVSARLAAEDLIVFQIPYGRHSFDYYYAEPTEGGPPDPRVQMAHRVLLPWVAGGEREPYRWIDGLYTNAGMAAAEVDRRMAELTAGSDTVWLVATEVALWDERDLVHRWLEKNAQRVDEAQFTRVDVYRYALP